MSGHRLTDYPGLRPGDRYVIATAGGDGEDATAPIREYVIAEIDGWRQDCDDMDDVTPEDWVDSLYVYRHGEEIATWDRCLGWHSSGWEEVVE